MGILIAGCPSTRGLHLITVMGEPMEASIVASKYFESAIPLYAENQFTAAVRTDLAASLECLGQIVIDNTTARPRTDALFDTDTSAVAQESDRQKRGSPGRVRAYIESVEAHSFPQLIAQPASEVERSISDQVVRFTTNPKRARDKTPVGYLKFAEIYSDLFEDDGTACPGS